MCDHAVGAIRGKQFLVMRAFDVAVHACDLADALGVDDRLDEKLCSTALSAVVGLEGGIGRGIVPVGKATELDDVQTRPLDLAARAR